MRLDKYLAHMGYGTRKEVKKIIKNGWVTINDQTITQSDHQVNDDDIVRVDDETIDYVEYEYYMLNKPAGYLSACEDEHYPVVMDLISSKRNDLYPVGRLDLDTEGLLIITNDGQFTHRVLSPKNHVMKKYYVEFDGTLPDDAIKIFEKPMAFVDFTSKPSKLEIIDEHKAYLTIHEGKFHQVKRMFEKVNCTVTYLKRISFGNLELGDLEVGKYIPLSKEIVENIEN